MAWLDPTVSHTVGSFPTQEEAVVARDAYLRGETVIKPANLDADEDGTKTNSLKLIISKHPSKRAWGLD